MNKHYLLIIVTFTLKILAMEDTKLVPLAGPAQFSPSGRLLLVFEEEKVALHETLSGRKLGELENRGAIPDNQRCHLVFSPQETYLGFKNQIWTLSNQKEHLQGISKSQTIQAWNTQETFFLTESLNSATPTYMVNDATGVAKSTSISFPSASAVTDFAICHDGNLLAFSFHFLHSTYSSKTVLINRENSGVPFYVEDGYKTIFFPDNIHALVSKTDAHVCVINAQLGQLLHTYLCGNSLINRTPCKVDIKNMQSTVTHSSAQDYFCRISYDGKNFTFQKIAKPAIDQKLLSNTKSYRLKRAQKGPQLYLHHLANASQEPQLLLDSVNTQEKDASFCGNYDEHVVLETRPKTNLCIVRPFSAAMQKIPYSKVTISPDTYSLEITTPQDRHILCILPHAYDLLARERNSYFNLLTQDLRNYLRYFQTPQDDSTKATHD
jgi:hypothetical protein